MRFRAQTPGRAGGGSGDVSQAEFDALAQQVAQKQPLLPTGSSQTFLGGDLTVRGIVDNLTTDSDSTVLSARQGKALKDTADLLAGTVAGKADTATVNAALANKADSSTVANKADIDGETYTGTHDFTGGTVRVADGVADSDAASMAQLNAAVLAVGKHVGVRVATTAAVDPATGMENGDTVDSTVLATGDLVFRNSTTDPELNGVYVVPASGAASRDTRLDTYDEHPGCLITVAQGTYAGGEFRCISQPGGTLDTTALEFVSLTVTGALMRANNGSDILDPGAFRANLQLGSAALKSEADLIRSNATVTADQALQDQIDALEAQIGTGGGGGGVGGGPGVNVLINSDTPVVVPLTAYSLPCLAYVFPGTATPIKLEVTASPLTIADADAAWVPVASEGNLDGVYDANEKFDIAAGVDNAAPTRIRFSRVPGGPATNSVGMVRPIGGSGVRPLTSGVVSSTPSLLNLTTLGLAPRATLDIDMLAGTVVEVDESFDGTNYVNAQRFYAPPAVMTLKRTAGALPTFRIRLISGPEGSPWEAF